MGHGGSDRARPEGGPDVDQQPAEPTRLRLGATGIALGVAIVVVLGFAPAAFIATDSLPMPPQGVRWHVPRSGSDAPVRALPAGIPTGPLPTTVADVAGAARSALGPQGAEDLLRILAPAAPRVVETAVGGSLGFAPYPYRYPALTRMLDDAPGRGSSCRFTGRLRFCWVSTL